MPAEPALAQPVGPNQVRPARGAVQPFLEGPTINS
jgi:hypothetical protein